jgi:hypothetical protein
MDAGGQFSEAQYRAVVDALRAGMENLSGRLTEVSAAARAAAARPGVPPPLAAAMVAAGDHIVDVLGAVLDAIVDAVQGVGAPVLLFLNGLDWLEVKRAATQVQGVLRVDQLPVGDRWKGYAADRYAVAVRGQSDAAGRIGTIADRTATALLVCASAGLAFYAAIGYIVVKLIAAAVAAIASFGSVVFSWSGALYVLSEAGLSTAAITAFVVALTALIGSQVLQLGGLIGELSDNGVFHEGHWPSATTQAYSDATVTDGDAEWSFER